MEIYFFKRITIILPIYRLLIVQVVIYSEMSSESDGSSYSEMDICDDGQWKKVRRKRKARNRLGSVSKKNKAVSREEINEIIFGSTSSANNLSTKTATKTTPNKNIQHKNFSPLMKEITHKKYKYMFHLLTDTGCTRITFCDLWDKIYPKLKMR